MKSSAKLLFTLYRVKLVKVQKIILVLLQSILKISSYLSVDGPSDVKVQVKGTVRINCTVLWDPAFELEVNWKKDNVDLVTDGIKATIDPLDKFLTIRDLTFADAGKKGKP